MPFAPPVLDKKEICTHLSEYGAPKLSVENLLSPSPEVLIPIYDFLVTFVSSYDSREESMQPGFEAIQMLGDYPELYSEAYAPFQAVLRLKKFMIAAGAHEFSVPGDLYRPESQRTIRFLSAAINFIMYSNHKAAFAVGLHEMSSAEIANLQEVCEEKSKIENEIAQIEEERMAVQPQVEALEVETKELNNRIQALNKQQHGMQLDINNLKQEDINIVEKISNFDFEMVQKQQEGATIRSQIVENPKELQKILDEKKLALSEEEELGKKCAESCETWKAKTEIISQTEKKILKLQTLLQNSEEQANDRNTDKVLKERRAKVKALEKEGWSLDAMTEELNWGVRRSEELAEKLSQQLSASSADFKAVKARHSQCIVDHDGRHFSVVEQDSKAETFLEKTANHKSYRDNKVSQLDAAGNKLLVAALNFSNSVFSRKGGVDIHDSDGDVLIA